MAAVHYIIHWIRQNTLSLSHFPNSNETISTASANLCAPIVDTNSVDWCEVEVGTITGAALNTAAQLSSGLGAGARLGAMATGVAVPSAIGSIINRVFPSNPGETGGGFGGAAGGIESVLGVSPNQFVTLLMRGPKYKRHQFDWQLSPTNQKEAESLRQIIKTFKKRLFRRSF